MSYVIATTDNQLYQFLGNANLELLFNKYKDNKSLDLACKNFPSQIDIRESSIQMFYKKDQSFQSFIWLTNAGLCYGTYGNDVLDKIVKNFVIVPYCKLEYSGMLDYDDIPISIAQSEFHFFLLFVKSLTIISKITHNVVHSINFEDSINKMIYHRENNTLFLHNSNYLYRIRINNESRDVWKAYLEKEDYEQALNHCKSNNLTMHSKRVSKLYANNLYERGEYVNCALRYSESDEKFEEVALKLLIKNQYEALKIYLTLIDNQLSKEMCMTQKTLLATWLCEIYLHEINNAKNTMEHKSITGKFKVFMMEKLDFLDKDTIYQLLHQYGRSKEFLEFAEKKKDYETVILYHVNEKNYNEAIEKLKTFIENDKSKKEKGFKDNDKYEIDEKLYKIFSKYSPVFMKFQPEKTIQLLLNYFKNSFDPNKIISAIMNTQESKREKVAEYLGQLISHKIKDKNVHNLYIFFLSSIKSENSIAKLLIYLQNSVEEKKVQFEVEYSLKVFGQFEIPQAQAWALTILGKHDDAVKLALESNYYNIATSIADTVKDDDKLKKQLWLEIFKHQMKDLNSQIQNKGGEEFKEINDSQNFNLALKIMQESNILKIEDILPNLQGNIKIEVFKNEILNCLQGYQTNIESLRSQIISYNITSKNVKNDINSVKKKCCKILYQSCICEICNNTINEDSIFVFPCGHMFDSNCILNQIKNYSTYLPHLQEKVEKMIIKKNEIENLEKRKTQNKIQSYDEKDDKGTFFNFIGFNNESSKKQQSAVKKISISNEELMELEKYKKEYIELLTEECVMCGDMMLMSIKEPFVSTSTKESWLII